MKYNLSKKTEHSSVQCDREGAEQAVNAGSAAAQWTPRVDKNSRPGVMTRWRSTRQ